MIKNLITAIVFSFSINLTAGSIWQAMELFESDRMTESADAFRPFCNRSPIAYYYCQNLVSNGFMQTLNIEPELVNIMANLSHPLVKKAHEPFAASMAYKEMMTSTSNRQIENSIKKLLDLAKYSQIGTAYYLLAKSLITTHQKGDEFFKKMIQIAYDISANRYKMMKPNDRVEFSNNLQKEQHIAAITNNEFRSICKLARLDPTCEIAGKRASAYNAVFSLNIPEYEIFERLFAANKQKSGFANMAAFLGSSEFQLKLGVSSQDDQDKKLFWLFWAGEQRVHDALNLLGGHFQNSDPELAFKYEKLAAPLAAVSQRQLAIFYGNGVGTERDAKLSGHMFARLYHSKDSEILDAKSAGDAYAIAGIFELAKAWYEEAIHNGTQDAIIGLARLNLTSGMARDQENGLNVLFSKSKESGYDNYQDMLHIATYIISHQAEILFTEKPNAHEFLHLLTSYYGQLEQLFLAHLKKHPEDSQDGRVLKALGLLYSVNGQGELAEEYLKKAALKQRVAWIVLGILSYKNNDLVKANLYLEEAYKAGLIPVIGMLADIKIALGQDERAVQLLNEAFDMEYIRESAFNLAYMHFLSRGGLSADVGKIKQLLKMAIDKEDERAAFLMGEIYFNGSLVAKDLEKAQKYFEKAQELKQPYAQMMVWLIKFMKDGRLSEEVFKSNLTKVSQKISAREQPNEIFNFLLRLNKNPDESQSELGDQERDGLVKVRSKLEGFKNQKEVRIEDFNQLASEILLLTKSEAFIKRTKSGFLYRNCQEIFTMHKPHEHGTKVSGTALKKGCKFLNNVIDGEEKKER